MTTISKRTRISAPRAEVWERLAELDQISMWAPGVETSVYSSDNREGIGAGRTCDVPAAGTLNETVDQWETEESLGYVVDGANVLDYWRNSWQLEDAGDETILTFSTEYKVKYGFLGSLMDKVMLRSRMEKATTSLVASFKYYVEQGEPVTEETVLPLAAVT